MQYVGGGRGAWGRGFGVCLRTSVRLVGFGSGGIQVEGLQYVGLSVIRGWFLKWYCFSMVWVRRLANFGTRWGVEARGVGRKLRPKVSTSVSTGDSWWEERFLMDLFLKLV